MINNQHMNHYTHTIFKSNKCDLSIVDDYKRVSCKGHINVGDILLIEHCYNQKIEHLSILSNSIRYDRELFNGLYPRNIQWKEEYVVGKASKEIESLILEKLQNNVFGTITPQDPKWWNHLMGISGVNLAKLATIGDP